MPLSDPAPRKKLHHRAVVCTGFQREDGLWDVEGHLVDTKTYGYPSRHRGQVQAGEPVHDLSLRLTMDDRLVIRQAQAATDASPFPNCTEVTHRFRLLEGLRIGPGWRAEVARRLGGVKGCTHLVEMLGPLATTAMQTIFAVKHRESAEDAPARRPAVLDTCHALASDGEVVKELWPRFYRGA